MLGGVQDICNMPFLMLREGHNMANQTAPEGVKRHSSGVKHSQRGVEKNLGGVNPPNPPRKSAHEKKPSGL